MKAYSVLSKYYSFFMKDNKTEEWADFVNDNLSPLIDKASSGIDLACGDGFFTRKLKRFGYNVIGIDISLEMLIQAREISAKENIKIEFLQQNMKNFKSFHTVDFITCINDGFNYLNQTEIIKAFKNVYKTLKPGGIFMFDISSAYKLRNVIGNNLFGEDTQDVTYLWFNELNEKSVKMDLTFFSRQDNNIYIKNEESHEQFIHEKDEIIDNLKSTKFEILKITGHLGADLNEKSERLNFIVRK